MHQNTNVIHIYSHDDSHSFHEQVKLRWYTGSLAHANSDGAQTIPETRRYRRRWSGAWHTEQRAAEAVTSPTKCTTGSGREERVECAHSNDRGEGARRVCVCVRVSDPKPNIFRCD